MKVEYNDDKLVIYLKNEITDNLEDLCHDVIGKLDKYFNIELKGFYDVNVYVDKCYGTILEFIMEDLDIYIDFSKVDLNVIENNNNFLYEVEDILDINVNQFYLYKEKYYINYDNVDTNIIEFGHIVYKDTNDIINNSQLILM